ncbi:hypothetical protein [Vibrio marisflavi]|uniref:Uncharacterized protein n=1 Tax=Vibrio marisflavi CECT 7928 TaxID=634439 RepID=A0ABN8ECF7_9VIBR|nr:hypothetical protein [Vibrio marisflavi]CAH0543090.1 hypothetical protein VMF7928_04395 [Vibrio marisflavi CECT 7928]
MYSKTPVEENLWVSVRLTALEELLPRVQTDQAIPDEYSELRTTSYTESEYYGLLMDRKILIEYTEDAEFPACERPPISQPLEDVVSTMENKPVSLCSDWVQSICQNAGNQLVTT